MLSRSRTRLPRCKLSHSLKFCYALVLLIFAIADTHAIAQGPGSSGTRETFVLSGTVVNSVTGEPIPRALVRTNGLAARTTFSDGEGHFQFEDMPAGQVTLTAQKPGYSSEQDDTGYSVHSVQVGATTGSQTVKLQPQGAIWGRITDVSGQPIEHIAVRLSSRALREGRKSWEQRGMTETDEDGRFRFPNLMPATYYLAVGPAESEGQILPGGAKPTTGFPHLYYPGVADLGSAAPIQLAAGQQAEADLSLSAVPIYRVTGTVTGEQPDRGVGLLLATLSGDDLSLPVGYNMELGTFNLDSVPAGSYILKAYSNSDAQRLNAEQRINVASNLENVHLALAPAIVIPVNVHQQSATSSGVNPPNAGPGSADRPPVSIALLPTQPDGAESFSTFESHGSRNAMTIQNVNPGTYTVSLMPQQPWYVQSASYGQTNVLYDDINVASGQSYPLEITVRDDSASLTASVRTPNSDPLPVVVVIVPQPATKSTPRMVHGISTSLTLSGLAPGDYLVFAFDHVAGLEYANPDALAPYVSQAAHVTLSANQKSQITLDLIQLGKGE
jgi:hypothetical protein